MGLQRTVRDGTAVVVKHTAHPATFEAEGLAALAGAPVPTVHEVGDRRLVTGCRRGGSDSMVPPTRPTVDRR